MQLRRSARLVGVVIGYLTRATFSWITGSSIQMSSQIAATVSLGGRAEVLATRMPQRRIQIFRHGWKPGQLVDAGMRGSAVMLERKATGPGMA